MTADRLRVFVSSKMQKLALERREVRSSLDELEVNALVFEKDARSRAKSIQQTYLSEVDRADLYIGLFWKGHGEYTIEEFEHARKLGPDFGRQIDKLGSFRTKSRSYSASPKLFCRNSSTRWGLTIPINSSFTLITGTWR
jgi:hypothetical protein